MTFEAYNNIITEHGAAITSVLVKKKVTSKDGYDTYRIYLNLSDTSQNVYTLVGRQNTPLSLPPAFHVDPPFGVNIGGVNPAFFPTNPDSEFDSWITVGIDDGSNQNTDAISAVGIDFDSWTETTGLNVNDGAIFWMDPDYGPERTDPEGNNNIVDITIAQFTVPTGNTFSFITGLQGRSVTGDDWYDSIKVHIGECMAPDSVEGYNITGTNYSISDFNLEADCADGYSGTAQIQPCSEIGQPYTLSGCVEGLEDCTTPEDITGYNIISEVNKSSNEINFEVNVSCNTDDRYRGEQPFASVCPEPGQPYTLSGCSLPPTCSGYSCPPSWTVRQNLSEITCANDPCEPSDCCTQDNVDTDSSTSGTDATLLPAPPAQTDTEEEVTGEVEEGTHRTFCWTSLPSEPTHAEKTHIRTGPYIIDGSSGSDSSSAAVSRGPHDINTIDTFINAFNTNAMCRYGEGNPVASPCTDPNGTSAEERLINYSGCPESKEAAALALREKHEGLEYLEPDRRGEGEDDDFAGRCGMVEGVFTCPNLVARCEGVASKSHFSGAVMNGVEEHGERIPNLPYEIKNNFDIKPGDHCSKVLDLPLRTDAQGFHAGLRSHLLRRGISLENGGLCTLIPGCAGYGEDMSQYEGASSEVEDGAEDNIILTGAGAG